jgi:hypothetical protein
LKIHVQYCSADDHGSSIDLTIQYKGAICNFCRVQIVHPISGGILAASQFKMKLDSTSTYLYASYWAGVYGTLTIAKCELNSSGACESFTTLNSTSSCSFAFYKAACVDIDETNDRLLYCLCNNNGQVDVYSSDFDGNHVTSYNVGNYFQSDLYVLHL